MSPLRKSVVVILSAFLFIGCVGRTGKVGKPISAYYETQLEQLKLGETTPDDLKNDFTLTKEEKDARTGRITTKTKVLVYLKEAKIENGKKFEIWELDKGGGMDVASFVVWGYVAYNKDQELTFHFEDGKLVSYESVVLPDPVTAPVTPVKLTNQH